MRLTFPRWAGLAAGPASWAVSTQANYAVAPATCGRHLAATAILSAILALIAFVAAALSYAAWRETQGAPTARFIAGLGMWSGLMFGAVIAMQGVAGLILSGCER
jgi:hypothetical protein